MTLAELLPQTQEVTLAVILPQAQGVTLVELLPQAQGVTLAGTSPSGTRGDLDLSRCLAIPFSPFGLIASNNKIANDTSGIIKSRTSKDRQCNSKK